MTKLILAGVLSLGVLVSAAPMQNPVELKEGDVAPGFSLPGTDGKTHKLSDYKGRAVRDRLVPQGVHRWLNGRVQVAPCERRGDSKIRHRIFHGERR
jgi:hypothetical protein